MTPHLCSKRPRNKTAQLRPQPLSGGIAFHLRSARAAIGLGALAVLGLSAVPALAQVQEADQSQQFTAGSNGYQADVPSAGLNLLSSATLTASQPPNTDPTASQTYTTLVDGSYGIVPNAGGGGQGEVAISSNTTLTYNLDQASGFDISAVDIFTGWGDGGRFIPTVTVEYSTIAAPSTFITLQNVNYTAASGNGAFVSLTNLGLSNTPVGEIQFVFGGQQNGYVGYTELSVLGSQASTTGDVWVGGTSSDWGDATNWQSGNVPANDDLINFGGSGSNGIVDLGSSGRTVSGLTFQAAVSTTIGSILLNTLTLDNGPSPVTITVAGTHAITAAITNNSDLSFSIGFGSQLTIASNITEGVAGTNLTLAGQGTLVLSGLNHYTGVTTIENGVLNVATFADYGQDSSLGNRPVGADGPSSAGILFRGGTLQYTGSTPQSTDRSIQVNADGGDGFDGGATLDASGSNPSATLSFTATSPIFFEQTGTRTLTFTGTNTGTNTFATEIDDNGGATSVMKSGTGTWYLTSTTSSYSGITIFAGGILNVASLSNYGFPSSVGNRVSDAQGSDANGLTGLLFRGGTLQYTGSTPQSTNRSIRINANGGDGFAGGATIDASGVDIPGNPPATLSFTAAASADFFEEGGNRTLTLTGTNTDSNVFNMQIVETAGQTSFVKTGPGTWDLTSTSSSYTGVTTIGGGILNVASLANYGVASSLGARPASDEGPGDVGFLFEGGTLQYTGSTPQSTNRSIRINADGQTNPGDATIDASGVDVPGNPAATVSFTATSSPDFFENPGTRTLTLTGTNTDDNTFAMAIIDQATNSTTFVKNGVGTWVLTGASTYSGVTNVNQGILVVNGSLSGTASVPVAVGATLAGAGSIATGGVTVSGTLAPGIPGTGLTAGTAGTGGTLVLTLGGQLVFNPGSTMSLVLGQTDTSTGGGADTGTVAFGTLGDYLSGSGNATLSLSGSINYSDTYYVFENVTSSGFTFSQITGYDNVDYTAQVTQDVPNNSYDLTFTPVPEPTSAACLLGGLALLSGWRRHRG